MIDSHITLSALAASPALVYLMTRRGPLSQLVFALNCARVLCLAVRLAACDLWRDKRHYWRRAITILSESERNEAL